MLHQYLSFSLFHRFSFLIQRQTQPLCLSFQIIFQPVQSSLVPLVSPLLSFLLQKQPVQYRNNEKRNLKGLKSTQKNISKPFYLLSKTSCCSLQILHCVYFEFTFIFPRCLQNCRKYVVPHLRDRVALLDFILSNECRQSIR